MVERGVRVFAGMFVLLVGSLMFVNVASAGIGIYINQESVFIREGESACVSYGVYNPLSDDSSVVVSVSEELSAFLVSITPDSIDVPAETSSGEALPIEICFQVPETLYEDDRSCAGGDTQEFSGTVNMAQVSGSGEEGGSDTSFSLSGPLTLRAGCIPDTFNFILLFSILTIVFVIAIVVVFIFKVTHKKRDLSSLVASNTALTSGQQEGSVGS